MIRNFRILEDGSSWMPFMYVRNDLWNLVKVRDGYLNISSLSMIDDFCSLSLHLDQTFDKNLVSNGEEGSNVSLKGKSRTQRTEAVWCYDIATYYTSCGSKVSSHYPWVGLWWGKADVYLRSWLRDLSWSVFIAAELILAFQFLDNLKPPSR